MSTALFSTFDSDEDFVDGHSSDWAGGVHGAEDHAAARDEEFDGLHVAAVVIGCPPSAERFEFGFDEAVCDWEGEPKFVAHGFDFILCADGCGDDVSTECFEFV